MLEGLSLEAREGLWQLIPAGDRAAVLLELSDHIRTSLLGQTSEEDIYAAMAHMDTAEISALLPVFAYVFYGDLNLSLVIFASMIICLGIAAIAGTMIPYHLLKSGKDPIMGSSVMLTAVTDTMGFFISLGMASVFLI